MNIDPTGLDPFEDGVSFNELAALFLEAMSKSTGSDTSCLATGHSMTADADEEPPALSGELELRMRGGSHRIRFAASLIR
ncbi:MAG: hypothetical protein K1X67_22190 [Fimbriimonadaceae bacterium]|nr:hypothetical protein [Fimbriimonadaceae bacterium]